MRWPGGVRRGGGNRPPGPARPGGGVRQACRARILGSGAGDRKGSPRGPAVASGRAASRARVTEEDGTDEDSTHEDSTDKDSEENRSVARRTDRSDGQLLLGPRHGAEDGAGRRAYESYVDLDPVGLPPTKRRFVDYPRRGRRAWTRWIP